MQRVTLAALFCLVAVPAMAQLKLRLTELAVSARYPVANIGHEKLARILATDGEDWLLFDVREEEEFEVSRIEGALRVDPDATTEAFLAEFGDAIGGKKLLFYCSVGYRSSIMATRVGKAAKRQGALRSANLRGGLFRWYNEGHPVHDDSGEVDAIHPFDESWGKLIIPRDPNPKPPAKHQHQHGK